MVNRTTAAIVALLVGGFGIHRFMTKQVGLGIAYLLFFWTFIPAIIAFIDFIIWITMSDEAFNAKYNADVKPSAVKQADSADALNKLFDLKEKGVITEEEFQAKKAELL